MRSRPRSRSSGISRAAWASSGPSALAWLASTLPAEPVGAVARMLLAGRQQPDGRWRSEDGAAFDAATTLRARLRVLSP